MKPQKEPEQYPDGKGIISFLILEKNINVIKKFGNLSSGDLSSLIVNMEIVIDELRDIVKGGISNVSPTL